MNVGDGNSRSRPSVVHGHRRRLRQRFGTGHLTGLQDYEALELLLTFSLPRIDTKPIARTLLKRFGGLVGVFGASEHELQEVAGVGPRTATLLTLLREVSSACLRDGLAKRSVLNNPGDVADYARMALAGRSTEACLLLFLDAKNHIIGEELVAEGTVDRATVLPRRVIELALSRKAAGFILIHNHPSGTADPSAEDDRLTRKVKAAAAAVELRFVDHLIVASGGNYSYRQSGAM